jgi:hypothetical protein
MSGTGAGVVMLLIAIGCLGGGIAIVVFAGKALAAVQDPDITVTNSQTGQSAKVGKGGLLVFILAGILVVVLGVALVIGAVKAFGA